jgi:hypothetical protein
MAVGLIFLIAVVVGIIDAAQAPVWRRVAAERRQSWEARAFHGVGTAMTQPDGGAPRTVRA